MKGQLLESGNLGKAGEFDFVDASVIADHLNEHRSNVLLTVGLKFRNPRINDLEMTPREASKWLLEHNGSYVFEAWYTGNDDYLHVQALSGNDLF